MDMDHRSLRATVLMLALLLVGQTVAAEDKTETKAEARADSKVVAADKKTEKRGATSYTHVVQSLSPGPQDHLQAATYHTKGPVYEKGFVPSPTYGYDKGVSNTYVKGAPGYGTKGFLAPGYGTNKGYLSAGYGTNKGFFGPGFGNNKGFGHAAYIPVALIPVYSHHGYGGHGGYGYGGHGGYGYGGYGGYGYDKGVKSITYTKEVPVPVPHLYPVTIEKKIPYPVKVPVPVPFERPVPVHVYKPVPVPVEKPVPYPVEKPVPYPVKVPVKVPVVHPVPYPVPTPVPYLVKGYKGGYDKGYDEYSSGSGEYDGKSAYTTDN